MPDTNTDFDQPADGLTVRALAELLQAAGYPASAAEAAAWAIVKRLCLGLRTPVQFPAPDTN